MLQNTRNSEIQIQDYVLLLWKRKWVALIALAAVVLPVILYVFLIQQTKYESTAALLVKIRNRKAEIFDERHRASNEMDVDTEVEVMKSPAVLGPAAAVVEAASLDPAVWLKQVEWTRIEETSVVHITAVGPTPELARDVANSIGESYINYSEKSQLDFSRSTLVWLERQLAEAKSQVRRDEQKISDFRKQHPNALVGINSELDSEYHQSLLQQTMEMQLQQAAAQKELDEYGSLLKQCGIPLPGHRDEGVVKVGLDDGDTEGKVELLTALADSERLTDISAALDAAKAALDEKLLTLKEQHPDVVALKQQISTLEGHRKAAISTECQRAYIMRRARASGLQTILQAKVDELARYRQQMHQSSGEQLEYEELQQNLDASRMLQNVVLTKLKEFDVAQGSTPESGQFIQKASLGLIKSPHNGIKLAFAVLCGLVIAFGTVLAFEYFDTTVKTSTEAELAFNLPVIGVVPEDLQEKQHQSEADLVIILD